MPLKYTPLPKQDPRLRAHQHCFCCCFVGPTGEELSHCCQCDEVRPCVSLPTVPRG